MCLFWMTNREQRWIEPCPHACASRESFTAENGMGGPSPTSDARLCSAWNDPFEPIIRSDRVRCIGTNTHAAGLATCACIALQRILADFAFVHCQPFLVSPPRASFELRRMRYLDLHLFRL